MNDETDRIERLIDVIETGNRNTRTLEGTIEQLIPALLKNSSPPATNTARTTVTHTDKTPMWVCVVIVVALGVALFGKGDSQREEISRLNSQLAEKQAQLNDVRNDIRELRRVDADHTATDNAIRAYINTGILKPKSEVGKGN